MAGFGLVRALPDGPLDIIGDVHGELRALEKLLAHLERRAKGEKRHIVFVGDLVDRGPDSPGVVRKVAQLMEQGRASCVLGNHELNLLRASRYSKRDNSWFRGEKRHFDRANEIPESRLGSISYPEDHEDPERPVLAAEHWRMLRFLATLPLALEREDIRVVHAAWHPASIAAARAIDHDPALDVASMFGDRKGTPRGALGLHEFALAAAVGRLNKLGLADQALADQRLHEKHFPIGISEGDGLTEAPEHSEAITRRELLYQNENPVRVITSGIEAQSERIFVAGGKWRFTKRDPWWREYEDEAHVVMGHYWRGTSADVNPRGRFSPPDPFEGESGVGPLVSDSGPKRVWCIDFSVGKRFLERHGQGAEARFTGRLACLRWPEREIVFDDGESHQRLE
ncbi:MAG: metallophosphoesterase [Planctomycetota bacterium]|nr:metallophosphoesterase [Planctomycetota bacterium]